jgi:RNA polymerase sigma-70 factor (ECF subfamily)
MRQVNKPLFLRDQPLHAGEVSVLSRASGTWTRAQTKDNSPEGVVRMWVQMRGEAPRSKGSKMMRTNKMPTARKGNSVEETELLAELLRPQGEGSRQKFWAEFVRRYERLITSCVLKVLRRYGAVFSSEDLDDLVGDVWVTLLRDDMKKLRQYDVERGFRIASFIGLVATNTTIDHLRSRQAEATPLDQVMEDYASLATVGDAPSDAVEQGEQAQLARVALSRLSTDERKFVFEVFHAERSPEELARTLGVTTNTIYSRKFKIREKLAKIVAQLEAA